MEKFKVTVTTEKRTALKHLDCVHKPKYKEILIVYAGVGWTLPPCWRIQPWHTTPSRVSHCHANLAGVMSPMSFGRGSSLSCPKIDALPKEGGRPHPIGSSSTESCTSCGPDASGKCYHASTVPGRQPMPTSRSGPRRGSFRESGSCSCRNMTATRVSTGSGNRWTA